LSIPPHILGKEYVSKNTPSFNFNPEQIPKHSQNQLFAATLRLVKRLRQNPETKKMIDAETAKRKYLLGVANLKGGIKMTLGKRLRELRGHRNREKVAADLGISPSAIGMYECGKRIPRDGIKKKIANYYNLTVQQLFFED